MAVADQPVVVGFDVHTKRHSVGLMSLTGIVSFAAAHF